MGGEGEEGRGGMKERRKDEERAQPL